MSSSEKATRKNLVDQALTASGWRVVSYARWQAGDRTAVDAVEEFPTDSGPGDYMLVLDGQPVADVEVKKLEIGPQNVIEQAKRYARTLPNSPHSFGEFRIPFVYATNGQLIYACDLRDIFHYTREVARFHTPDALREALGRDLAGADVWLRTNPINDPDRTYQQEAIAAIENGIRNGKRQMLIAMATGTGISGRVVARLEKPGDRKSCLT